MCVLIFSYIDKMRLIHIKEGLRMFSRARRVKKEGIPQYEGSAEEIAEHIIDACWDEDKQYFRTSAGHFCEFWTRDFGMCAESLMALGYEERVLSTLDYALAKFAKHGRMTTTISPKGVCFDFPNYGADSLPFIIHALKVADGWDLIDRYRGFLESEINYYFHEVFDRELCLVRKDRNFSSMKDYAKRRSPCYSNCMLSMLNDDLSELGLPNPFARYSIKKTLLSTFWNGKFFYDDLSRAEVITGDANTFPFWCGVTDSPEVLRIAMTAIDSAALASPFPLKYTASPDKISKMDILEVLAGDYERDTVWMHLGLCFLDVMKKFDNAKFNDYLDQYTKLMEQHKNFLEVYDHDGKPFKNAFYFADDSLLWVAKWLQMMRE
jgi:hypothetical protein